MLKAALIALIALRHVHSVSTFGASTKYEKRLNFVPNAISAQEFSTSSLLKCAMLSHAKQQSCSGFSYSGSVCEIVTGYISDKPFVIGSGKQYFTEINAEMESFCLNRGTINIWPQSSNSDEVNCTCVDLVNVNDIFYLGNRCEKTCRFLKYPGEDLPKVDLYEEYKNTGSPEGCLRKCTKLAECKSVMHNQVEPKCVFKYQSPLTNPEKRLEYTKKINVLYALSCS